MDVPARTRPALGQFLETISARPAVQRPLYPRGRLGRGPPSFGGAGGWVVPAGGAHGFGGLSEVADIHCVETGDGDPAHERMRPLKDPGRADSGREGIEPALAAKHASGAPLAMADVYR